MQYSWWLIGSATLAAILAAIAAGFLPARRAANLPVHEALKYE